MKLMHKIVLALLGATAIAAVSFPVSAADLPRRMATKAPPPLPAAYNWTGFYVGLNAGGSWGRQDNSLVSIATGGTVLSNSDRIDGFIGGGQIGYNWQTGQWVLGIEADFQGSAQKGDGSFFIPGVVGAVAATSASYEDKLNWFGTVRGRVGWAFDRWMPYITGGYAYGHGEFNGSATTGAVTTSASGSQNYSGWTVGGGVEWAFYNNWSAKLEYLYIDFGDGPAVATSPTFSFVSGRLTDNIVRVGLNYKCY
jgi:outer membrane immunogenic protein